MKHLPKNMSEIEKPSGEQDLKKKKGAAAVDDGEAKEEEEETKAKRKDENAEQEAEPTTINSDEVGK